MAYFIIVSSEGGTSAGQVMWQHRGRDITSKASCVRAGPLRWQPHGYQHPSQPREGRSSGMNRIGEHSFLMPDCRGCRYHLS